MKRYSLVLFDIDGTLMDFDQTEDQALKQTVLSYGLEFTPELVERYKRINAKWWKLLEEGKIRKAQIQDGRFADLWQELGLEIDPKESGLRYVERLEGSAFLYEGAAEICRSLAKRAKLAIVTNGIARVQHTRIAASGFADCISAVLVSEEVGFAKPDSRYFEAALRACNHTEKEDVLIIGDSLAADIRGGNDFGIDTCWINRAGLENTSGITPTYTIVHLNELEDMIP